MTLSGFLMHVTPALGMRWQSRAYYIYGRNHDIMADDFELRHVPTYPGVNSRSELVTLPRGGAGSGIISMTKLLDPDWLRSVQLV